MSEQGDGAVNPGQAIYDALSDEAKAAVDALPERLFTGEEGQVAARRMADSIRIADKTGPSIWSVICDRNGGRYFVALNVAMTNLVSRERSTSNIVLRETGESDVEVREYIQANTTYRSYSNSEMVQVGPIDGDASKGFPGSVLRAHQDEVIAQAGLGWSRNQRWKWHRDDWRVKLALITGEDLPAPSYVPEDRIGLPMETIREEALNSGQAIYDALSDEAKAAVDALPDDLFEDDDGVDYAQRIVHSLKTAHQLAPDSWALVTYQQDKTGFVALNITGENAVTIGDTLRFVVQRDLVNEQQLGNDLQPFVTGDGYRRRDYLVQVGVDSNTTSNARDELYRVHDLTLQRIAKGKVGLQGRNHRDDIRVKLALLTGEDIPAPGYVPVLTHGIAYGLRRKPAVLPESASHAIEPMLSDDAIRAAVKSLPNGFSSVGLTYTPSQIASFYTALQTKGFVILSGISGTGKSKIALQFTKMLPDIPANIAVPLAEDYVRIAVQPYMKKYKRIRLWNEVSEGLPVPPNGTSVVVPFSLDGRKGKCRVWNRPETNAGTYIFPQGELGEEFKDLAVDDFAMRFHIDENEDEIASIEMRSELPTEPDAGVEVESWLSNRLFLSVRPNWRDGKPLIGYHNPLSGEYQRTPFVDFVITAANDFQSGNRNAFFVILDEMNLAHVEYYFADVLSVIESGRDEPGWTIEGISLAVGEDHPDLPQSLRLPPNLYIVGTVNMDETTHPFSPKVLDRAFTIELSEVDFNGYPPGKIEASESGDEDKQALLRAFVSSGYPRIDKRDIREVVDRHGRYADDLQSLYLSLRRSRMHFGYRVFDEIMQFVFHAEANGLFTTDDAFDHAVLMKVLPKFNGSRAKLQTALFELLHWCHKAGTMSSDDRADLEARFAKLTDDHTSFDTVVPKDTEAVEDQWRYPATGRRAALMMQDLYADGFAAFG